MQDGRLSHAELAKVLGEDMAQQCITAFDKDQDKLLSKEEWIEGRTDRNPIDVDSCLRRAVGRWITGGVIRIRQRPQTASGLARSHQCGSRRFYPVS